MSVNQIKENKMNFLMLPYFVGCIYEGGATQYIRVKTDDKDKFILDLLCKMDDFLPIMNAENKCSWPTFKIEGIEVPCEEFFTYDKEKKQWYYEEPSVEEYPGKDFFVVELCQYGFSHYYFLKASSKEELLSAFENSYKNFVSKKDSKPKNVEIFGEKFDYSDLVYTDIVYDKKGRVTGYKYYPTFENVYTREEWFNAENF